MKLNTKGWALPLVLLLVAILPLLAAAIYNYTDMEIKQINIYKNSEQAEYISKSSLDAVINSWKQSNFDEKPSGELERIYYMKNGHFILESEWEGFSQNDKTNETLGYVDVTVSRIEDSSDPAYGCTRFTAISNVSGIKNRMTIVSSPYLQGHETVIPMYNYDTGHINYSLAPMVKTQTVTKRLGTQSREKELTVRIFDGQGTLEMKTDNNEFYLNNNEFVGMGANMITFHKSVNLNGFSDESGIIIAAEVIIFKQPVHLRVGTSSYGTIVFQVPGDMGISVSGKSGEYAKVYFVGGVTLHDYDMFKGRPKKRYISPGDAYYIRKKNEQEGLDLTEWMVDVGEDCEDFIKITDKHNNGEDIVLPIVNDHIKFLLEKSK